MILVSRVLFRTWICEPSDANSRASLIPCPFIEFNACLIRKGNPMCQADGKTEELLLLLQAIAISLLINLLFYIKELWLTAVTIKFRRKRR